MLWIPFGACSGMWGCGNRETDPRSVLQAGLHYMLCVPAAIQRIICNVYRV